MPMCMLQPPVDLLDSLARSIPQNISVRLSPYIVENKFSVKQIFEAIFPLRGETIRFYNL